MSRLVLCLAVVASLVPAVPAVAAESAAKPEPARVAARREANYITVDNRPTLLLWAIGLTDPGDLEDYQAAGLNTLYVRVSEASEDQLDTLSALISAAEDKGLYVVVALAPQSLTDADGNQLAVDPYSQDYQAAAGEFAAAAAKKLSSHPRLIAWLIEAALPDNVAWGDEGFRAFLEDSYRTLDALNTSWGSELDSWDQVTTGGAREIDSTYPAGLGRASVDLAAYREQTYAKIISLWAKAIGSADPGRVVFASAITDYRSIASVTPEVDGIVLHVYPSVAEADWDTHNVHAVDIARRGNQLAAVQTLDLTGSPTPAQLADWAHLALLHGAAGVAFTSWSRIAGSEGLLQAVGDLADKFANDLGFPQTPLARVAVLYSPIAGGATRDGKGLYGYLDGVTPNEPTELFAMVKTGTRFGQFDVLTVDSLGEADLGAYGAIFAPEAFYLPEEAQLALQNFVLRGGALVLDSGVGMYQADGNIQSMPPVLREMLGLRYTDLSKPNPADEVSGPGEPGSPGGPGSPGDPGLNPMGPVERGLEVSEDLRKFADVLEQFLGRTEVTKHLGESFAVGEGPYLRLREMGSGFAVYLPVFLYEEWDPNDPMFVDFHAELLSRKADVEMIQPDALWPDVSVAVYKDWPLAVAASRGEMATVDAHGADSQLYLIPGGAMRFPNPEEDNRTELLFSGAPLTVANPVPIYLRPQAEGAVVTAVLVRYDADGIELLVYGNGAQASSGREGLQFSGGESTPVAIEIKDGAYSLARSSTHHLVVAEGRNVKPLVDQEVMPNAETGSIVIQVNARSTRITLEPVAEQGSE